MSRPPTFLLSFDFDGTLVHPESDPVFHPELGRMIRQLREQGAGWVINTGRSLPQTLQGIAQYGLFMEPDFIIARECDIHRPGLFGGWKDSGAWNRQARRAHERFVRDHRASLDLIRRWIESETDAQFLSGDYGELGIVATSVPEMDRITVFIEGHSAEFPDIGFHRNGIYLRFSHRAYSKGTALAELARQLGLDASHCFAAGDNHNDLSMLDLRRAHRLAAPGNALDPVKAHVRGHGGFVADRPASEGMIQALHHYFGGA